MRKFAFSLADVYQIKKGQEKKLEDELMILVKSFDNINDRIRSVDTQITEYDARMQELCVNGSVVSKLLEVRWMRETLDNTRISLCAQRKRLEAQIDTLRQQHLRLTHELEVLDGIWEEEKLVYAKEQEQEQEKEYEGFMGFAARARRAVQVEA